MIRYQFTVRTKSGDVVLSADCSGHVLADVLRALVREVEFRSHVPFYFKVETRERAN